MTASLYLLGFFLGITLLFYVFDKVNTLVDNFRNRKITQSILCVPSGEIIEIKKYKFDKLLKDKIVIWDGMTNYYYLKDKYSNKYKIKKWNIS